MNRDVVCCTFSVIYSEEQKAKKIVFPLDVIICYRWYSAPRCYNTKLRRKKITPDTFITPAVNIFPRV